MKSSPFRWRAGLWLSAALFTVLMAAFAFWPLVKGDLRLDSISLFAAAPSLDLFPSRSVLPAGSSVQGLVLDLPVPFWVSLLSWVGLVAWLFAATCITYMMYRLFGELGSTGVLNSRNYVRLRLSGWLLILSEAVRIAATLTQDFYIRLTVREEMWTLVTFQDRNVHLIFGGLLLLGLAHAFRIGIYLREDAEMTI